MNQANARDITGPFESQPDSQSHRKTFSQQHPLHRIALAVVNGDIRDAKWPVLVGHYQGDPIVSVEAILNRKYDYKLSRDLRLGRYPGAIGSVRLYEEPDKTGGVLVTGLGEPGQLTRNGLEAALRAALMEYALAHVAKEAGTLGNQLSICSLLIGSYGGGRITIEDTVIALGNAAFEVNQTLEAQELIERVRIGKIQFFELYRDIAIEAAHATRRLQEQRPEQFIAEPSVDHKSTARFSRPYSPYGDGWNRRIRIRTKGNCLNYEFTTDLARNEPLSRQIQWELVNSFLTDSAPKSTATLSTLFQYLLPYQFVNQTTNLPDIVLDLDPESAKIPWELLDAPTNPTENRDPIGVRVSILRTLATITPRANPRRSLERRALVIGAPADAGSSLPGALAEAQAVATLLNQRQLDVKPVFEASPHDIMNALYACDYDIVHVAAHGEFHQEKTGTPYDSDLLEQSDNVVSGKKVLDNQSTQKTNAGVVLADGLYLGSNEFSNLPAVPSIVFLNCCHLGKIDGNPVGKRHLRQPGQFSASLAEHLVEMGVGVVIVAGWAVKDEPAKVFAESLYTELLNGENLSHAVHIARFATYRECEPGDVTWGAFQVYGDPGYVLHWAGRRGGKRSSVVPSFVSPNEFTEHILDMGTRGRGGDPPKELCEKLRELENDIPSNWGDLGRVWDAFGESYMGLGASQDAIEAYQKAIEKSGANIRTIEQLANARSRIGEKLIQAKMGSEEQNFTEAQEVLKQAYEHLEALIKIAPSSERFSLLGATYKRHALTMQGHEREARFGDAKEQYEKAIALNPSNLYYPLENKIGLNLLLLENESANPQLGNSQSDGETDSKSPRDQLLQEIESDIKAMRENLESCNDIWAKSSKVNLELLRFLARDGRDTATDIYNTEAIATAYYDVINSFTSTSEKERESVIKQIQLFAHYAKSKSVQDAAQQVLEQLEVILPTPKK